MMSVEALPEPPATMDRPVPTSKRRTSSVRCGGSVRWQLAALVWLGEKELHSGRDESGPSNVGGGGRQLVGLEAENQDNVAVEKDKIVGKEGGQVTEKGGAVLGKVGLEDGGGCGGRKRKVQVQTLDCLDSGKKRNMKVSDKPVEGKLGKGSLRREAEEGEAGPAASELASDSEAHKATGPMEGGHNGTRRQGGAACGKPEEASTKSQKTERRGSSESKRRKGEELAVSRFITPGTALTSMLRKHNLQLVIQLTPQEIEADFLAITGRKVPRRSATTCRTYQKYPRGEWQTKITK